MTQSSDQPTLRHCKACAGVASGRAARGGYRMGRKYGTAPAWGASLMGRRKARWLCKPPRHRVAGGGSCQRWLLRAPPLPLSLTLSLTPAPPSYNSNTGNGVQVHANEKKHLITIWLHSAGFSGVRLRRCCLLFVLTV